MAADEPPGSFAVGGFDKEELIAVGLVGGRMAGLAPGGCAGWRPRRMRAATGPATAVLDALVAHALTRGATGVWCNARTPARSLYERAGFRVVSEEFEIPGIGPHLVMERDAASTPRQL